MVAKKGKKSAKKVQSLSSRGLSAKQARTVKGGAVDASLPAVQKVREALCDGSVRPVGVSYLKQ